MKQVETMAREMQKEINDLREKVEKVFGGKLDYLDDLPNPPKKPTTPFPYGGGEARPYGWFSR